MHIDKIHAEKEIVGKRHEQALDRGDISAAKAAHREYIDPVNLELQRARRAKNKLKIVYK